MRAPLFLSAPPAVFVLLYFCARKASKARKLSTCALDLRFVLASVGELVLSLALVHRQLGVTSHGADILLILRRSLEYRLYI